MHLKIRKLILYLLAILLFFILTLYLLQRYFAHRHGYFVPDYPRVTITESTDYETIYLQTGLGESAVRKLLKQDKFETVLYAQENLSVPSFQEPHRRPSGNTG